MYRLYVLILMMTLALNILWFHPFMAVERTSKAEAKGGQGARWVGKGEGSDCRRRSQTDPQIL